MAQIDDDFYEELQNNKDMFYDVGVYSDDNIRRSEYQFISFHDITEPFGIHFKNPQPFQYIAILTGEEILEKLLKDERIIKVQKTSGPHDPAIFEKIEKEN